MLGTIESLTRAGEQVIWQMQGLWRGAGSLLPWALSGARPAQSGAVGLVTVRHSVAVLVSIRSMFH